LISKQKPLLIKIAGFDYSKIIIETNPRTDIGTHGFKAPEIIFGRFDDDAYSTSVIYGPLDVFYTGCTQDTPPFTILELCSSTICRTFPKVLEQVPVMMIAIIDAAIAG
jgi:hypothetical protein